jgi:hypothetical protein
LFFEKNANFFAENCQKLQQIVIISSTLDILQQGGECERITGKGDGRGNPTNGALTTTTLALQQVAGIFVETES